MQSVALGKGKILLEAWQTYFIRDLVTSETRTFLQITLKHRVAFSFGRDGPSPSILSASFFAFFTILLAMEELATKKYAERNVTY